MLIVFKKIRGINEVDPNQDSFTQRSISLVANIKPLVYRLIKRGDLNYWLN